MLLLAANLSAQTDTSSANLVFNPSFEDYTDCPRKIDAKGVLTVVEAWYQPTAGSADYFNRCATRECAVPRNKLGCQQPRTGDAYCGIYCSKNEYREYLQTQLREPLRAGCRYRVSFHLSLSENSTVAVSSVGALFTAERITDSGKSILMHKVRSSMGSLVSQTLATYYTPQVVSDRILSDTAGWMQVSGEFTAAGGEEFLTIGNFYPSERSGVAHYDWLTQLLTGGYYYIDDVRVTLISAPESAQASPDQPNPSTPISKPSSPQAISTLSVGATVVLHDIYFQFDRSTILQQSYKELSNLVTLLRDNPRMRIEIGGHTDDQGSASYNQRLSESRAKAVADYLTAKGIEPKRLQYRGYGKSRPIADNSTEEGQAKNRRVEIKILSK